MSDGLKKFFDPKTIPNYGFKAVPVEYFEKIRHRLQISFALSSEPTKIYQWNDPVAQKCLSEFKSSGGSEILVERELYEQKIKELAES